MIRRAPLLSAGMLLAALGPVHAQSPVLPLGEWGHSSNHGLDCSPPFLRIEPNRIIKRLGGGEGRCPITKIRKSGKSLIVDAKCVYDKSILEENLIEADDDDDSFSLVIKSSALILFNNTPHGLCRAVGDGK